MELGIQVLRRGTGVRESLERDGWMVHAMRLDVLSVRHAAVKGEPAARRRLYELGLLTSAALRIEFVSFAVAARRSNEDHEQVARQTECDRVNNSVPAPFYVWPHVGVFVRPEE